MLSNATAQPASELRKKSCAFPGLVDRIILHLHGFTLNGENLNLYDVRSVRRTQQPLNVQKTVKLRGGEAECQGW